MTDTLWLLLTFACGVAYECGCAMWVHYSEANRVRPAMGWSGFVCLVSAVGLGEALHRPLFIAVYAAGFMTGTWLGIRVKSGHWTTEAANFSRTRAAYKRLLKTIEEQRRG